MAREDRSKYASRVQVLPLGSQNLSELELSQVNAAGPSHQSDIKRERMTT